MVPAADSNCVISLNNGTALFLREVGESDELFRKMVAMVETNNRALKHEYAKRRADLWASGPTMGNPAWYYAMRVDEGVS